MANEAFEALTKIDGFAEVNQSNATAERLGGLTNRNYKIDCVHGSYVLRLAGEGTGDYIDRQAEFNNASIASAAGVNADIVYFNVDDGTMLCRYIDNASTLDIAQLRDEAVLVRTGKAFRQLHDCGELFQGRFELFEQVDQYLKVVTDLKAPLPDGFLSLKKDADKVREALALHPLPLKPCHCDPMVENCIDDGHKVFIIDFEYAGNNDPMWDLGDISVEGDFTQEQDRIFLDAYFSREATKFDYGRMVMYKAMCDLLWTLWGVVQHANQNPVDDFWGYAVGRMERCQVLMSSDDFPKQLKAVIDGP